jgi:hypothetical protein
MIDSSKLFEKCALRTWFPILKWDRIPNLGACHTIELEEDFRNSYFVSKELEIFYENLLETLVGGYESHNLKIMGKPGCGKTSFINYLARCTARSENKILKDYFIYRFRSNRVANTNVENTVIDFITDAWLNFFIICNKSELADRIMNKKVDKKYKINDFTEYYKRKKGEFDKKFIFVIDNADLLKNDEIYEVVYSILRHMEINVVKKWLVIRESTYNEYTRKTKNIVDAFFSDKWDFPQIHLHDVIKHRIRYQASLTPSTIPKYPFSSTLCRYIMDKLFDGNMRESLSLLRNILENSPPGKIKNETDELFIQEYLDKNAINTILILNLLPNLYDRYYRSSLLPLPVDIICTCRYVKDIDLLRGIVNTISDRRTSMANLIDQDKTLVMRTKDFEYSLEKLYDAKLLEKNGKLVELSGKGSLLSDYVNRARYIQLCKALIARNHTDELQEEPRDVLFWKLVGISIDHAKISLDMISWDKPNLPESSS